MRDRSLLLKDYIYVFLWHIKCVNCARALCKNFAKLNFLKIFNKFSKRRWNFFVFFWKSVDKRKKLWYNVKCKQSAKLILVQHNQHYVVNAVKSAVIGYATPCGLHIKHTRAHTKSGSAGKTTRYIFFFYGWKPKTAWIFTSPRRWTERGAEKLVSGGL